MTKTNQQLQIQIFKVLVFVVCRVAELHPFVRCVCFLSGSGIRDLGHLHWNTHCIDSCNIFFQRQGPGETVGKREHKTKPHSRNVTKHSTTAWNTVVLTDAVWQGETAHYCGSISEGIFQSSVLRSICTSSYTVFYKKNVPKGSQSFSNIP